MEVDIAQNLLPDSVAESDILESNKSMTGYHNSNPAFPLGRFMIERGHLTADFDKGKTAAAENQETEHIDDH